MKNFFYCLILGLMAFQCGESPEPSPANSLSMEVWASYGADAVSLQLRGTVFRLPTGPVETRFDQAEVYVSEGQPGHYQLLTTTSQTRLPLPSFKPGVAYYVAAKGRIGTYTSELSKPALIMTNVVPTVRKLMPYDRMSSYSVAPAGWPVIRQYREGAASALTTQLLDAAGGRRTLTYSKTENGAFFCQGWNTTSQQVLFEISRNKKRALVSYDLASGAFTDVSLPAEADLWNYAVAPDGRQVVFTDYKRQGLWYFDGQTNTQRKLGDQSTIHYFGWTADSRYVLLTKPVQSLSGGQTVVQYDPKTDKQTDALAEFAQVSGAKLSPDGKHLLFQSTLSGRGALWLQDRQTRALRPVGNGQQYGWLSDGSFWTTYELTDNISPGERESHLWVCRP